MHLFTWMIAHSLGVLGPQGRGTAAYFNLTDKVDLIMGTFSKSLASIGGFIAAEKNVIEYLKHHARSLMFSASISPAAAASALAALNVFKQDTGIIEKLWENTNHAIKSFKNAGFELAPTKLLSSRFISGIMTKLSRWQKSCLKKGSSLIR